MVKPAICPAAIWRKFSLKQQSTYRTLLGRFRAELRTMRTIKGFEGLNKHNADVIAHNLVCEAIWVLWK